MSTTKHSVDCACGAVELSIEGEPQDQWYCHCNSCAKYYQVCPTPFVAFKDTQVTTVKGEEHMKTVNLCEANFFGQKLARYFCEACGYRLYNTIPGQPFRGMPATNLIPPINFKPAIHEFCGDVPVKALHRFKDDGLPKLVDITKESGGSGKLVAI